MSETITMTQHERKATFWHADEETCIAAVLRAYREEGRAMTVRHYYYKLLNKEVKLDTRYKNTQVNAYKYVVRLLTRARKDGRVPWAAVVDTGRRGEDYWCYDSIEEFVQLRDRPAYPLDIWRGQPRRLEIWIEKDGLYDMVCSIAAPYRVPVHVVKGYDSVSELHEGAERIGNGRGWTVLYVSDFDPSGDDIEREIRDALAEENSYPQIVRVALTKEQTLTLPQSTAQDLKDGDSRTKGFIAKYGADQKGFEVEAMPAHTLAQLIENAIRNRMDLDALRAAKALRRDIEQALGDKISDEYERIIEDEIATTYDDFWDDDDVETEYPTTLYKKYGREFVDRYVHPYFSDDEWGPGESLLPEPEEDHVEADTDGGGDGHADDDE